MRILLAGTELTPFARTGGLGDVLEGLPAELLARGHEVSVVIPSYRGLHEDPRLAAGATGVRIEVPLGAEVIGVEILAGRAPNGVQVFLVRHDESFHRLGLYGANGHDFPDNAKRFILFSKCVLELARRISPGVDIIHVHDWPAALVPALVKARRLPLKTVLTIHNIAHQGSFPAADFALTNLPPSWFAPAGLEFYGGLNLLKSGVLFADAVTAVSKGYAREIQTSQGGAGLAAVVREHAHKLSGILNGADYTTWNPATDKLLPKTYKASSPAGKKACRSQLLTQLDLAPGAGGPVFAMIAQKAEQRGLELVFPVIDRMLSMDARLVVLGTGGPADERDLMVASRRHAKRFAYRPTMDERLEHLVQAGADVLLVPSQFEPSGLTTIVALKYGTLPIAGAGGLSEIVQDYDPSTDSGTGFVFYDSSPEAVWDSILRVQKLFADAPVWKRLIQRAMNADFGWSKPVLRYEALYAGLVPQALAA